MKNVPVLRFPPETPQFGNTTHIQCIREFQKEIIEAEEFNANAKEYEVEITWEGSKTVRVIAASKEEAEELAAERVDFSEVDDYKIDVRLAEPPKISAPISIVELKECLPF